MNDIQFTTLLTAIFISTYLINPNPIAPVFAVAFALLGIWFSWEDRND